MIDLTGIVKQVTKSSNSMNHNGKVNTNTFKAFCGKDEYNKYIYRKLRRDTNKTAEDVANYLMDNWKYNQFSAEVIPNDVARCVLPTPLEPTNTTFSCLSTNPNEFNSSNSFLFTFGWKSNS